MKTILMIAAAAASAVLLVPTASLAQSPQDTAEVQARVEIGNLDLSNEADRAKLDRKLESALRRACGHPGQRDLSALMAVNRCVSATLGR